MANPEHLARLKEGINAWSEWRQKNPALLADLRAADLSGEDLRKAQLIGANLSDAHLCESNLGDAHLCEADLIGADLRGADLRGADLTRARLTQADLRGADLRGADLTGAELTEAELSEADFTETEPSETELSEAELTQTELSRTNLHSETHRVFISYARRDGIELARRLQKDLAESGFDAWLDTQRIGGGAVWSTEIDEAIKSCGVMLALLSPGSYESEICRSEQLLALDRGSRVIPVLAVKGADRPVYLYARQYRDFTDDDDYAARLAELLADIRSDATATLPETYRKTRVTYLTAPPRVANYLERPEALRALRDALFAEDRRQPIALTALAGMGGIGKTVLAKALTEDEVVQRAFPHGIVWITAGKERKRDFIEEMREVAKALGDDLSRYDTALACENQYRTTIATKAALIVVDDVWTIDDIKPLLAESPRSRFLFTTRDAAIGRFVGAHEHRADLLDVAQSRELLASWANVAVAELPATADEIIDECGRLPLALSVVGAMLRGTHEEFWKDTLDLLLNADLSAIEDQLPEGQQSFFKAVEVSFQSLKTEMQERYKGLAVLLDDMAAPLPILETLWNVSEAEARRISRLFVDRSLAQPDSTESIRLHDLQLDYVRAQYPDKEALELIHGAVRLSSNVITRDPSQFTSQMVGRLLSYQDMLAIGHFTGRVVEGTRTPWLRPLHPALDPPGTGLVFTLEGHSSGVSAVAISADGQLAVSASRNNVLKVWDLMKGRELHTLRGHSDCIHGVAISPDGRLAISASNDNTLKVWDLSSGRELRTLKGHSWHVQGVALSGDGRLAVSASHDKTLKVWDVASGRELRTLIGHSGYVLGVALDADARVAVSAGFDGTLKVWDVDTGRNLRTLGGGFPVLAISLSKDGRLAIAVSPDQIALTVWDVDTGRELRTFKSHSSHVRGVALSADGRLAVSASEDNTLKLWDLDTGRELRTFTGHTERLLATALTPDGQRAVSASDDHTLKVWDLDPRRELRPSMGHSGSVNTVVVIPGGQQRALSVSWDMTLKLWDLGSGRELRSFPVHSRFVDAVAVTQDGKRAVSAAGDGDYVTRKLKVWDLESGRELRTLTGHSDSVNAVAVTPDGQRAVSASNDKTLKVWELGSGRELRTLTGHSRWVTAVAVTPDGQRVVSASADETLKVWELSSGRELRTLRVHFDRVHGVVLTRDGRLAVSVCGGFADRNDDALKVWDVESGRELRSLAGHSGSVYGVALSADGRLAVSASEDKTLKVWDVESGRELRTLTGHTDVVIAVVVTPDGQRAVSASQDKTLRVWDIGTGGLLSTFTCDGTVRCCALADDHKLIVAGDAGGHVHFLRLEEANPSGRRDQ